MLAKEPSWHRNNRKQRSWARVVLASYWLYSDLEILRAYNLLVHHHSFVDISFGVADILATMGYASNGKGNAGLGGSGSLNGKGFSGTGASGTSNGKGQVGSSHPSAPPGAAPHWQPYAGGKAQQQQQQSSAPWAPTLAQSKPPQPPPAPKRQIGSLGPWQCCGLQLTPDQLYCPSCHMHFTGHFKASSPWRGQQQQEDSDRAASNARDQQRRDRHTQVFRDARPASPTRQRQKRAAKSPARAAPSAASGPVTTQTGPAGGSAPTGGPATSPVESAPGRLRGCVPGCCAPLPAAPHGMLPVGGTRHLGPGSPAPLG